MASQTKGHNLGDLDFAEVRQPHDICQPPITTPTLSLMMISGALWFLHAVDSARHQPGMLRYKIEHATLQRIHLQFAQNITPKSWRNICLPTHEISPVPVLIKVKRDFFIHR
jgi:hypothetical protein